MDECQETDVASGDSIITNPEAATLGESTPTDVMPVEVDEEPVPDASHETVESTNSEVSSDLVEESSEHIDVAEEKISHDSSSTGENSIVEDNPESTPPDVTPVEVGKEPVPDVTLESESTAVPADLVEESADQLDISEENVFHDSPSITGENSIAKDNDDIVMSTNDGPDSQEPSVDDDIEETISVNEIETAQKSSDSPETDSSSKTIHAALSQQHKQSDHDQNDQSNANDVNVNHNEEKSDSVTKILKMKQSSKIKFGLLIGLIKVNAIQDKEIVDAVLQLLVDGPFDMENNFVIESPESVVHMLEVIEICNSKLKAELWSVFLAIIKKSKRNLMACAEVSLMEHVLQQLPQADDIVGDLLIELLGILASFSITVKELKHLFNLLKARGGHWPRHSVKLLSVLKQMPVRHGPDEFFSFPGKKGSAIGMPPVSKWPYQNGWSFNCWFHLDPVTGSSIEREKPYLFCFRTSKGVGYSGHFLGNALVITAIRVKGKGFQHCVRYEFQPRKWYMVTIVHVYNRWSKSEVRCYVDGQLFSLAEMNWVVSTNDLFDRCLIGSTPEQEHDSMFSGQISCVYGFSEALSPQQISAIHALGPAYKGQFKFESESNAALSDTQRKVLYEGRLSVAIMFTYNPVACDRQLCLDQTPKANASIFPHSPHALMMGDVKPVITHSIHSTLHSLGGVQIFFPLFGQLDCLHETAENVSEAPMEYISSLLISLICDLVKSSLGIQQQFLQSRGFLVISHYLERAGATHTNEQVLETLLMMCRHLMVTASTNLLKQIYDHILYNPALWIKAPVEVQMRLYSFLATEFLSDAKIFNSIRRVSAVLQSFHTLKYYYWIVHPRDRSGYQPKTPEDCSRPDISHLATIRASILVYVKQLVLRGSGILDDELQAILNYLTTVFEDDNLRDVLYFTLTLMAEQPSSMVPAFDRKHGVRCVFKLLASEDPYIRIHAIKLLGFYLMRSTHKRKHDSMGSHNLFSLVGERLLLYAPYLDMATYNALFEMLTEKMTIFTSEKKHPDPDATFRLENPLLLKVIAHLIRHSKQTAELREVRKLFLSDITILCNSNKENRRTVLQMSVWQDWMFSLAPIYPNGPEEERMTDMVMALFRLLLHHAVKYEYGGWRVWIDTLAILHSKVAYEDFRQRMTQVYQKYEQQRADVVADPEARRQLPVSTITGLGDRQSYEHSGTSSVQITEADSAECAAKTIVDEVVDQVVSGIEGEQSSEALPPASPSRGEGDIERPTADTEKHPEQITAENHSTVQTEGQVRSSDVGPSAASDSRRPSSSSGHPRGRIFSPGPRAEPFRIPEFTWSYLHQKLLSDLLSAIEADLQIWKSLEKNILEFVNSSENHVYVINLIHLVSQLSDTLVTSCGGLLPLLAAATSPNGEVDMLEPGQGMLMEESVSFLLRLMNLADIVVFASSQNFQELEQEKNMASGGILRQCLRLVCTCAVRNCLECRYRLLFPGPAPSGRDDPTPPDRIQELIRGLRSQGENSSIRDQEKLLQDMDVNRLRAVVYRDVEETKQAQFLSLAIVYFLSVLMVSKYRDILEPPTPLTTPSSSRAGRTGSQGGQRGSLHTLTEDSSSGGEEVDKALNGSVKEEEEEVQERREGQVGSEDESSLRGPSESGSSPEKAVGCDEENGAQVKDVEDGKVADEDSGSVRSRQSSSAQGIASIQVGDAPEPSTVAGQDAASEGATGETSTTDRPSSLALPGQISLPAHQPKDEASLTERLERALGSAAPLLREVFIDFASYLSKTLIGSHGQELLAGGLVALKQSTSVVELVMLLCSQEWQNSLQKNAGLAFIELVNEGRLLSHATRDHIVRVANEAEFILNRMRAEDVERHADFEQVSAQTTNERREEENLCDHLIASARRRDYAIATRIRDKVTNIMTNQHGPWGSPVQRKPTYYRLDLWEDDSRRRRRLVPNPYGSSHPEATLAPTARTQEEEEGNETKLSAVALGALRGNKAVGEETYGVTDEELMMTQSGGSVGGQQDVPEQIELEVDGPVALSTKCILLAPGVTVHGLLSITKSELYFEMDIEDDNNKNIDEKILQYVDHVHGKWSFNELRAIFSRRYLHKNVALEIFVANRCAIMFVFPDQSTVKRVVQCLPRVGIGVKYNLPQNRKSSLAAPRQIFKHSNMTQRWQRREISNFDYLMYLNTVAGRTFNDLNQYPIFPWVLANYESGELDLSAPSNYRDLSMPIGALNPARKAFFDERYANWDDDSQPAFHYGTHYSTAAFVLNYLVRLEPFTTMFLGLQGGKFDHANRTFHAVGQTWKNCQRDTSDVKELIPEFFYLPEMLENRSEYRLGVTEEGLTVGDVVLPPWAPTQQDFVRVNRQALESEFVSCQLHQWIDLIFGYKQRGPEAVRATNVFCHLTYEGSVDWSQVTDPITRQALEDQIRSFGQTPCQLLTEPHPPRNSALHVSPMMFSPLHDDVCMMMKFLSNSPVVMIGANTHPAAPNPAVTTVTANHCYAVNAWNNTAAASAQQTSSLSGSQTSSDLHSQLPLSMDKQLAQSVQSPRRNLGDNFDERLRADSAHFATTPESRILFACGFWDKSFRVYALEPGRIIQVVYGHFGVVTCLSRSECNLHQDCYLATGSEDCTVLLWLWSNKQQAISGEGAMEPATPRATLTGHQEEVTCVMVSAELGLITSGSKDGVCLLHTTQGELLRSLALPPDANVPSRILFTREGYLVVFSSGGSFLTVFTLNGKLVRSGPGPDEGPNGGGRVLAALLSRCGQFMVTAGEAGVARVCKTSDLTPLYAFPRCDAAIRSLALTHDQRFLLAGLASGCLVVFNIDFNRWHHEFQERYAS